MELSWIDISVVGAYVLAMLGVGFYVFKRSPGFEEYLIAISDVIIF